MRALPALLFLCLLEAGLAFAGETVPHDHYNPVLLNEQAVRAARDGDTAMALILLERAVRIFPQDRRIANNLEVLRAWREGRIPNLAKLRPLRVPAAEPDKIPRERPPEPPPLWLAP